MAATNEMFEAHTLLLNQTFVTATSFSLKCAIQLGLADVINELGRPATLSELAVAASVPPEREPMLRRLMRLLVRQGVFADAGGGAYALTSFSKLLLRDGASMSPYVLSSLNEDLMKAWYYLADWMKGGGGSSTSAPFQLAHGDRHIWQVAAERPEINAMFNEAIASDASWVVKAMVAQVPEVFRDVQSMVDVGGGNGTAARIITEVFPEIKCIVYDLPHVIAAMPEIKGVEAVGGDMFRHIPPAQTVMLKNVLHDWGDEDCVKILKRCKESILPKQDGGKVIVVDIVLNDSPDINPKLSETCLFFDMIMMIGIGGKERDEHEWKEIFVAAGFNDYKVHSMSSLNSIIELFP